MFTGINLLSCCESWNIWLGFKIEYLIIYSWGTLPFTYIDIYIYRFFPILRKLERNFPWNNAQTKSYHDMVIDIDLVLSMQKSRGRRYTRVLYICKKRTSVVRCLLCMFSVVIICYLLYYLLYKCGSSK